MNEITTRNTTAVSTQTGNPFAEYADSVLQRTITGKLLSTQASTLINSRHLASRATVSSSPLSSAR